jgi:hypothetical protein
LGSGFRNLPGLDGPFGLFVGAASLLKEPVVLLDGLVGIGQPVVGLLTRILEEAGAADRERQ